MLSPGSPRTLKLWIFIYLLTTKKDDIFFNTHGERGGGGFLKVTNDLVPLHTVKNFVVNGKTEEGK